MIDSIAERIWNLIAVELGPLVVLIGASAHSGKSRLSRKLKEALTLMGIPVTTLSNDLWLRGINRPSIETTATVTVIETVMANVDSVGFVETVLRLVGGEVVNPPIYDSKKRLHVANEGEDVSIKKGVLNEGVLILDGSVVLAIKELREISSLNIYVDVPDEFRLGWIRQCGEGFKDLNPDEIRRGIETGQMGETLIAKASAEHADVIYQPDRGRLPSVVICNHK